MNGKIMQIMPCNIEIYAKYECEADDNTKVIYRERVLGFALLDSGYIHPLVFDGGMGVEVEDGTTSNFIEFERR